MLALCSMYIKQMVFLSIAPQIMKRQKNLRECDPFIDVQLLATISCISRDEDL